MWRTMTLNPLTLSPLAKLIRDLYRCQLIKHNQNMTHLVCQHGSHLNKPLYRMNYSKMCHFNVLNITLDKTHK